MDNYKDFASKIVSNKLFFVLIDFVFNDQDSNFALIH